MPQTKAQLASTVRLDNVEPQDFDTVFYPGGHGPMWDLAEDQNSIKLIEGFPAADKPRRPRLSRAGRAPSCKDA